MDTEAEKLIRDAVLSKRSESSPELLRRDLVPVAVSRQHHGAQPFLQTNAINKSYNDAASTINHTMMRPRDLVLSRLRPVFGDLGLGLLTSNLVLVLIPINSLLASHLHKWLSVSI